MNNQFNIQPLSRFVTGESASIRRPREIASFSYDDAHIFHLDERSLRYYYPPTIGADLSKGFDKFQQLDDTADDHLDSLLKTLVDLEQRTGEKCQADVITWRGMMTKIMATPFDLFNGKSIVGYKFETLSLLPTPWADTSRDYIESREDLVVNNHAQYCSVVRTGIGKSRLILGGEVDARHSLSTQLVWDAKPTRADDPINWVELKTAATPLSDRDILKYERKLLKFWIQSFLLGVPKIIVGFRSKDGILQSLEELETNQIPRLVKQKGKGSWDGNLCINFTAAFLDCRCFAIPRCDRSHGLYID
ncbi:MAG: hypothetical protein Q9186_003253 [Xanthomendoza sp. 1 TL-2023]